MHFRKKRAQINFNPKGGGQDMSGFKFSYQIITSGFELIENFRDFISTFGVEQGIFLKLHCSVANFTVCSFSKVGKTDTVRP